MELPPFERAVLIIRYYETLHGKEKWPTIGFGHVVLPGEPYKEVVLLTEREADALLRKDLKKFCAMFRSFGKDSLLLVSVTTVGRQRFSEATAIKRAGSSGNLNSATAIYCMSTCHSAIITARYIQASVADGGLSIGCYGPDSLLQCMLP